MKRTHLYIGAAVVLTPAVLFFAAWLFYPNLAGWYLRTRVLPKYEQRMGRKIAVEHIKVTRGHVVLEGLSVRGPLDGDQPLVAVGKISADFDFWASWRGRAVVGDVVVERPSVHVVLPEGGGDNLRDAVEAWRKKSSTPASAPAGPRRARKLTVTQGALSVDDRAHGAKLGVEDITASYDSAGAAELTMTTGTLTTKLGPTAGFDKIVVTAEAANLRGTARATIEGGRMAPYHALSLTGIGGNVAPGEGNRVDVDLAGGYGGVEGTLWRATGWFNRDLRGGEMHLGADRFTFDKLSPALDNTPILNPEKTSLGVKVDVILAGDVISMTGALDLAGLNIRHVMLAEKPIKGLAVSGKLAARYDRTARIFELSNAEVLFRGVKARLEGYVALAGGRDGGDAAGTTRAHPRLRVRLNVPEVTCQKALGAFPPELVPRISGFKLKGKFGADVGVDIDWANLEALELTGKIGIYGCEVESAPKRSDTAKLQEEFEHIVEVEKDQYLKFIIGPSNPDYVQLTDISPNLIASLTTTEDGAFFQHKGFIIHGFRTALIKNLQAGYFRYGASSITMQFVKNVLLNREKTISRKLQELFLTWYVEETLEKERILEIYLNAIEFGPGLYGIGRATWHYFGKAPKDLTLPEAAFFSTLLPNPKKRHLQYCDNKLWKVYEAKIGRILKLMRERDKITDEQLAEAEMQPIVFVYPEGFDAKKCRKETERIIKNSRSTTPSLSLEEDTVDVDADEASQEPTN